MARRYEVYKCEACGNVVWVMHGGEGTLVCCGEDMKLMKAQTAEMAMEKHVPVLEKIEGGYRVYVGSTEHPMTEAHYIEWISLCTANQVYIQYLKPFEKPEAIFHVTDEPLFLYEYCNLHGLWQNDLKGSGKAKEVAPEEVKTEEPVVATAGMKYICTACQYIYDPEIGDPDGGVEPGTAFADVPEDWVCPVCGVGKDMFEAYNE